MSQKTDGLIKLALVFFVALLSFSVGTYVGKKYSDNQHKLSMLEPATPAKPVAAPTHDEFATEATLTLENTTTASTELSNDATKPAALSDTEVAQLAEEFATDDGDTGATTANAETNTEKNLTVVATEQKDLKTVSAADVTQPAKVGTANKPTAAVTASPVDERVPASLPPKNPTPVTVKPLHFTVQIGSYPSETEAQKITHDLQSKGYKVSYIPAHVNGQLWYRVNVGLFGSIKEAQDYKKEFLEKTRMASAIVQRVQ